MAKADNVSKPPEPYLGVKFMLYYRSEKAGPFWRNENDVYGTFDWRTLRFSVLLEPDASDGEIILGLQESSGMVWFDNIKITVTRTPMLRPTPMKIPPPPFKGHELPRLRGVMSPNTFHDDDLRILGTEWKANVIRWQLTRNWGKPGTDRDLAEYDLWLDGRIHIYVGEFSAIRWAPGADNYLRDCIDIFEEYGWDWTYHAYREWDVWSVEHGSDPQDHLPTTAPSERKTILLNWFGKNIQPLELKN